MNWRELLKHNRLTVTEEDIRSNILENLRLGLKEAQPYQANDIEIMLLGGGWSLSDFEDDIRTKRESGMPLVTTNGAYNWCLDRGLKPSAQVIADGREMNRRFVLPHVAGCHYFLASQVHPEVVREAPQDQVLIWHSGAHQIVRETVEYFCKSENLDKQWFPVFGGTTVMLRAIPLMIMLGYRRMHVYGLDSCMRENRHHAYAQPENDSKQVIKFVVGGREFRCQRWMVVQAQQFIDMQKIIPDDCQLAVYGDGLIAHIINTGATLAQENGDGSLGIQYLQQRETLLGGRDAGP